MPALQLYVIMQGLFWCFPISNLKCKGSQLVNLPTVPHEMALEILAPTEQQIPMADCLTVAC